MFLYQDLTNMLSL